MVSYTPGPLVMPLIDDDDPVGLWPQTIRDMAAAINLFIATARPMTVVSRAVGSADLSVPASTETTVPFTLEEVDTLGAYSAASSLTNLVIPAGMGGLYFATARVYWTSSSGVVRTTSIMLNGVRQAANPIPTGTGAVPSLASTAALFVAAPGDIVTQVVWHNDTVAGAVGASGTRNTSLTLVRL